MDVNYLVTGGTWFFGAFITVLLIKEGEKVVAYNVIPRRDILEKVMGRAASDRIKIARSDVTNLARLIRIAKEYNTIKIIHTAALLNVASQANPALAVRISCDGMVNVLETARILGVRKAIYASSCTVLCPPEKYEQEYIPNDAPIIRRVYTVFANPLVNDWQEIILMSVEWIVWA